MKYVPMRAAVTVADQVWEFVRRLPGGEGFDVDMLIREEVAANVVSRGDYEHAINELIRMGKVRGT